MSQETSISTPSSDTKDSGSDDDDVPAIAEVRVTPTEAFYNRNNQSMKCLVVLCEGLKDVDGDDLLDIRRSPFSSLKRGDIKPTADMFRDEVVRRHQLNDPNGANVSPRPKNWTMEALRKWLSDNPILQEPDIDFLTRAVEHHRRCTIFKCIRTGGTCLELDRQCAIFASDSLCS
jgi:hypothetical protein